MENFIPSLLKAFAFFAILCSAGYFFLITIYFINKQNRFQAKLEDFIKDIDENISLPKVLKFSNYIAPITYVTIMFIIGFITLFLTKHLVSVPGELNVKDILIFDRIIQDNNVENIKILKYVITVVGFTLLGSFIGSAQFILKAFLRTNLTPIQFIQIGIKSTLVVLIALLIPLIFNKFIDKHPLFLIWISFIIGLFPFIKLKYFIEQLIAFFKKKDTLHDNIEFRYIEGINTLHKIKLKEIGIENVQNLAQYNLLLLIIKTPFPVKTIIDWIAQAQLIIVLRENYINLRNVGIRTILDMKNLFDQNVINTVRFAEEFDLNEQVITSLKLNIEKNESVQFLNNFKEKLGDADLMR